MKPATGKASIRPSASVPSYDNRSNETARLIEAQFGAHSLDSDTWQQVKLLYIGQLINHKQPELAETFFNLGLRQTVAPHLLS